MKGANTGNASPACAIAVPDRKKNAMMVVFILISGTPAYWRLTRTRTMPVSPLAKGVIALPITAP